jgi:hypothetical protein
VCSRVVALRGEYRLKTFGNRMDAGESTGTGGVIRNRLIRFIQGGLE